MLLFIYEAKRASYTLGNFNTSHVTVYQRLSIFDKTEHEFQYIPCYCLSI